MGSLKGLLGKLAARPYIHGKHLSRDAFMPFLEEASHFVRDPSRVLIVGAGGSLENMIRAACGPSADVTTLDVDGARQPDVVCAIEDASPALLGYFDAVFALEVFEHVRDPEVAVEAIRELMRPHGILVMSTPWATPLHDLPLDYRRYTPLGLADHLRDFQILSFEGHGSYVQTLRYLALRGVYAHEAGARLFAFAVSLLPKPAPAKRRRVQPESLRNLSSDAWPRSVIGWRLIGRALL